MMVRQSKEIISILSVPRTRGSLGLLLIPFCRLAINLIQLNSYLPPFSHSNSFPIGLPSLYLVTANNRLHVQMIVNHSLVCGHRAAQTQLGRHTTEFCQRHVTLWHRCQRRWGLIRIVSEIGVP